MIGNLISVVELIQALKLKGVNVIIKEYSEVEELGGKSNYSYWNDIKHKPGIAEDYLIIHKDSLKRIMEKNKVKKRSQKK